MYTIEQLLENYSESELGEGAALALSDSVKIEESTMQSSFGSSAGLSQGKVTRIKTEMRDANKKITETRVDLDEENGELVEAECSCLDFGGDSYACRHIVALQTAWIMQKYGRESLETSALKSILIKYTKVSDPFAPGILRKTSEEITNLLKANRKKAALPVKRTENILPGSLKIEISCFNQKEKLFELRTGSKRLYVVKDVREFVDAFEDEKQLQFGKQLSFLARKEYFDEKSRRLLGVLEGVVKDAREDSRKQLFFSTGGPTPRYIRIAGHDFDLLMEKCGADGILNAEKPLFFVPEERKLEFTVKKQEYGALLCGSGDYIFTKTSEWIYMISGNNVYRVAREGQEEAEKLLELTLPDKELYISEKDLPGVCTNIFKNVGEDTEIICEGLELSEYLPPKPKFRFYLDLAQPDMISCRPVAFYGKKEYPLAYGMRQNQNRDIREEKRMVELIVPLFQAYEAETGSYFCQGDENVIYAFLTETMPVLSGFGEVFISDKLKKLRVRPVSHFSVGVTVESGLLNLDVQADAFSRDELFEILSAYQPKKKFYRLKDGSFVKVDHDYDAIWETLSDCLKGLKKPGKEDWKLPLFRAMYLEEKLRNREDVSYECNREYRRLIGRMREAENSLAEPPESLAPVLRGYQADGFRWIRMLKDNGFGGILADDMGLGKTLQVQAFLLSEWEAGKRGDAMRTLIVTPASLLYNWKQELERYTPDLPVKVIAGSVAEREEMISQVSEEDGIWLTSYDLLKRDIHLYESLVFANEILDEAQYIKNQTTHASRSVRLVQSSFRLALTGTPIENRLSELWSIFDYLMPGFLFPYARFREEIEIPAVSGNKETVEKLRSLVHPFILRRLKKEVLTELPDKLEEAVSIQMEGEQRRLYDAYAQRLKMYLEKQSPEEFAHGKLEILAELTKLRQLCCDPALLAEKYKGGNAKLEACLELIHRATEGGHKILLFSQFTTMLDIIGKKLKAEGIAYYRIDGSVKKEDRIKMVDAFNSDDVPVFCISLKAGGTGLNLTAADIVIHYDPWWNLAAQNQATDRTHRIGQTHVVTVYQLIAADTVEEKITEMQKRKYQLAADVLSGEGISSIMIDKEQVLSLLEESALTPV